MKIRNGFVSNSSSSSFVAVGFNLTDHKGEKPNFFSVLEVLGYSFEDSLEKFIINFQEHILKNIGSKEDSWAKGYYTKEKLEEKIIYIRKNPEKFMKDVFFEEIREELDFVIIADTEDGAPTDDDFIIAEYIADISSEDYMETTSTPFGDVAKKFSSLEELRNKIAPDAELTLYTGTRMC